MAPDVITLKGLWHHTEEFNDTILNGIMALLKRSNGSTALRRLMKPHREIQKRYAEESNDAKYIWGFNGTTSKGAMTLPENFSGTTLRSH